MNVECHNCGKNWDYTGEKEEGERITCPNKNCGLKTRIEPSSSEIPTKKLAIASVALILSLGFFFGIGMVGEKKTATIKAGDDIVWADPQPTYSGIENIYIMESGNYTDTDNLSGDPAILGVITSDGDSVTIPYETAFDIVPAVKAAQENCAYTVKENTKVELAASGAFSIAIENTTDSEEAIFGGSEGGSHIRYNATTWDNATNGYKLAAGASVTLDPVKIYTWE